MAIKANNLKSPFLKKKNIFLDTFNFWKSQFYLPQKSVTVPTQIRVKALNLLQGKGEGSYSRKKYLLGSRVEGVAVKIEISGISRLPT